MVVAQKLPLPSNRADRPWQTIASGGYCLPERERASPAELIDTGHERRNECFH